MRNTHEIHEIHDKVWLCARNQSFDRAGKTWQIVVSRVELRVGVQIWEVWDKVWDQIHYSFEDQGWEVKR